MISGDLLSPSELKLLTDDSKMKWVVYTSKSHKLSDPDVMEIAKKADIYNRTIGVTGFLFHAAGLFLQVLEGKTKAFSDLVKKIENDRRHLEMKYLLVEETASPRFPSWGMKLIEDHKLKHEHLNIFLALNQDQPLPKLKKKIEEIIVQIKKS